MACARLGRGWRGGEHVGRDFQHDAHYFVLVINCGAVDQRFDERELFFGHLAAGAGVGECHGAGHFSGFEQEGELHGVLQRVAFGVNCDFQVVAVGLAGERDGLHAACDLFELRRAVERRVDALWQPIGPRDGKQGRGSYALNAGLHGGIASAVAFEIYVSKLSN